MIITFPESPEEIPDIIEDKVDLPEPFVPNIPTTSPFCILKLHTYIKSMSLCLNLYIKVLPIIKKIVTINQNTIVS